jgi:hypothetical protein
MEDTTMVGIYEEARTIIQHYMDGEISRHVALVLLTCIHEGVTGNWSEESRNMIDDLLPE